MPYDWVISLISKYPNNIASVHAITAQSCEVSLLAAAIRIKDFLPSNLIYACEIEGRIEFSGKTEGTIANSLGWGSALSSESYKYAENHDVIKVGKRKLHWWKLPESINIQSLDDRSWRDILNSILADLEISSDELEHFKGSINGVFANANSRAKRDKNYSVETVISAVIQRFSDRSSFEEFVNHKDFQPFVLNRAKAFFQ
ncbi:MAG: hypothetical protein V4493_04760 [Pseudomonadota bacterium]